MTHNTATAAGLERTANACMATALFPALMVSPFYATCLSMSGALWGMAYVAEQIQAFQAVFLDKQKENSRASHDAKAATAVEQRPLQLVPHTARKEGGHTARPRKTHKPTNHNNHKRANHTA